VSNLIGFNLPQEFNCNVNFIPVVACSAVEILMFDASEGMVPRRLGKSALSGEAFVFRNL